MAHIQSLKYRNTYAKDILTNALLFLCCWLTAVLDFDTLMYLPLMTLISHYYLTSSNLVRDSFTFGVVFSIGVMCDSFLYQIGVYSFPGHDAPLNQYSFEFFHVLGALKAGITPEWVIVLWAAFALTVTRSLSLVCRMGNLSLLVVPMLGVCVYSYTRALGSIEFSDKDLGILFGVWFFLTLFYRSLITSYDGKD